MAAEHGARISMSADAEREVLYSMDGSVVFLPYEMCATASKARYGGWRELHEVGMVEGTFNPRRCKAHVRWMFRFTADGFTPGAYKVWVVEVEPW